MDSGRDSIARRQRRGFNLPLIAALILASLVPAAALAAFPGPSSTESVRSNTPSDPDFDRAESDDEATVPPAPASTNVFDEQYARFGFAPSSTQTTALYNPLAAPARAVAQNTAAIRNPLGQLAGVSADRAWKFFGEGAGRHLVGDPDVEIAIMDTGIRWGTESLRLRISLNEKELPTPRNGGATCTADDCNNDGAFNVDDYANDTRVAITDGNSDSDAILDASDLIADFSGGTDEDSNGFVDDIAGWDFFDDDNDPYDASSYSAASNHGTGRANDAAAEGDDGSGGLGVCPDCQVVPMRIWDTFVADTNNLGQAVIYAADNDIEVVEGAIGGLLNTRFARESFAYAYSHGTLPVIVSSDLNTADHNYPTNYDQALHVQGTVADVNGLGMNPPQEFVDFFSQLPTPLTIGSQLPVQTWFRNSGTTQYGGHAHIVMPATTGSEATGQASGAAGLIFSYAKRQGITLEPNEVKQLLTRSAEDVDPLNTGTFGTPDPAQVGWDQHFGYGRPDLGLALERIKNAAAPILANAAQRIPPEALITGPDWFAPLNLLQQDAVVVKAQLDAPQSPAAYDWRLQWAPGLEPCEAEFQTIGNGASTAAIDGALGSINLATVRAALDARTGLRTTTPACRNSSGQVTGGSTVDPTAPAKGVGDVDPNEPAFTVRVQVTDAQGNVGEDRKVLFAYSDDTLHEGWSRPLGGTQNDSGEATTGGESSQRMYDLDGDNKLEIIEANSSGQISVIGSDGSPSPEFNGGNPVTTLPNFNVHMGAAGLSQIAPPNEPLRVPAIGDIDGDREPEIVDSAGQHVYAWEADGAPVAGFPVKIDLSKSAVPLRTKVNHIKPGFLASPALGDLDGDGDKEIAIAGLDQQLYVWRGDGTLVPNFPVYLRPLDANGAPVPCSAAFECAESINTPAIGDINGDSKLDMVVSTNEFDDNPSAPGAPSTLGGLSGLLTNFLAQALGGSSRTYAVGADGKFLPGWPITVDGLLPDVLPFVGPGVDQVMANLDGDPALEVIGSAATGDIKGTDGDGTPIVDFDSQPAGGETVDKTKVLNLFENPVVGNLDGNPGLEVMKGGITLVGVVNLGILTGQNLPYNHTLQGWSATTGTSLAAFPQAVEDYQLLSSPALADVSDAPGNEAIVGTGLYLIRNINSTGVEGTGWPKFTGGWNFGVPSVGDVDGDGKLEVAAQTREGFSFLWDTDGDACGAGSDEWRTSRHDEFNSGAYGTDARPPGSVENLSVSGDGKLSWTAPGDDWQCGRAESYRILLSADPIAHPSDSDTEIPFATDTAAGATAKRTLNEVEVGGAAHAAVIYRDEAGNWGGLDSVALPKNFGTNGARCDVRLRGTQGKDRLKGSPLGDRIVGRAGNDRIRAGRGDDCVAAGNGRDHISGQQGEDKLSGQKGNDIAKGNGGADRIRGGDGNDGLSGGGGTDRIQGKGGRDRISGGGGDDVLRGGGSRDKVSGGGGDDTIETVGGRADIVKCGGGKDKVRAGTSDRVSKTCEKVKRR